MADDDSGVNARLVVALEARLERFETAMKRAKLITNDTAEGIEKRTQKMSEKMKASLELINLEHQLDVARATGNSKVVEKLSEEVALRKTINKLTSAGLATEEARALAEKQVAAAARARAATEGVSGALRSAFGSTRLAVLEEGGAKVGIFGGALEKLGAAGLVAAAGMAAFGISLEEAHKAMEYADEVANTAKRVHLTTDALQEFRFALGEVGGAEKGADEALEAFSSTLGKAQAGLPKAQRAFKELGFSTEEVKGFQNAEEALNAVIEKIGGLKNNAQKDAVIDQLGLTGLKPLIEAGAEKMRELRNEAREVGVVMDSDMIQRGAVLNKKFEVLTQVIGVQLKQAFIDLGPVLVQLTSLVANMSKGILNVLEAFKPLQEKSLSTLETQKASLEHSLKSREEAIFKPNAAERKYYTDQIEQIDREIVRRKASENTLVTPPNGTTDLVDLSRQKTSHGDNGEAAAAVGQLLDAARKEQLQALLHLTTQIEDHAQAEKDVVDAETKAKLDRLNAERDKIDANDKLDAATKRRLNAELDQATQAELAAAASKKQNIDIEAIIAVREKELNARKAVASFEQQSMQIEAQLAGSVRERRDIELAALAARKKLADEERAAKRDAERARNPGVVMVTSLAEQQAADKAYGLEQQSILHGNMTPWEAWADEGRKATQDVGDAMERTAVRGMDQFNNGVAEAIVNGKNMRQVFTQIFKEMEADLVRYLLKQAEIGVFGGGSGGTSSILQTVFKLPGFGTGTTFAPGGAAIVGEDGPEVVNLPRGAQVLPNNLLGSLAGLGATRASATTIVQGPTFNLSGAVVTQDLLDQMHAISRNHAAQAAAGAVQTARSVIPADLQRRNMARLR